MCDFLYKKHVNEKKKKFNTNNNATIPCFHSFTQQTPNSSFSSIPSDSLPHTLTSIKLDEVGDLSTLQVNADGVVDLDERVWVADGAGVVGHQVRDSFGANDDLLHLTQFVLQRNQNQVRITGFTTAVFKKTSNPSTAADGTRTSFIFILSTIVWKTARRTVFTNSIQISTSRHMLS